MERQTGLEGIVFVSRKNVSIVQTPSFLFGEAGKRIYQEYLRMGESYGENPHFKLEQNGEEIVGANFPDANLINQVVRPFGARVILPSDIDEELLQMIDNKHYLTANALVLRSLQDKYNPANNSLAGQLVEIADVDSSRIAKEPAMITGFDIQPDAANKEYGFRLVATKDLAVVHDSRFLGKYNRWKFTTTDKLGLPEHLDRKKGERTWYTRETDDGVAVFDVNGYRYADSGDDELSVSSAVGRVVLVFAGGDALDISKVIEDQKIRELSTRL